MPKPTFIIGGVSRSGTSSLYRWLDDHPGVGMSRQKELRFFDLHYDRGMSWYESQFPVTEVRGEASPRYLATVEVAERIAREVPDVKLIFSLREPVSRAYSDYWMGRMRGRGPDRFEDALTEEPWRSRYIEAGHYADHLSRFYRLFPRDHVMVVTFDELQADPSGVLRRVCDFVGATGDLPASVGSTVNASVAFRSLRLRNATKRAPKQLRSLVARVNTRRWEYPPMRAETRQQLQAHYAPHNARLARLLPLDLSAWSD